MRLVVTVGAVAFVTVGIWYASRQSVPAAAARSSSIAVRPSAEPTAEGLVVHEWGTFTSFSGSDGVRLEFRPLADEDLPPFVLDRFLQAGAGNPFLKSEIRVRLRMETPVTYFYTPRERHVKARVSFPEGLLTEFYPPVARIEPPFQLGEKLPLKHSVLDWGDIHLIPIEGSESQIAARALSQLPASDARFRYGHARDTDSALVHVRLSKPDARSPFAPSGDFCEKFLFYRGVGNFELPLMLSAASDGSFDLVNAGHDPVGTLFLVDVDGPTVRFSKFDGLAAGSRLNLPRPAKPAPLEALAAAVKDALVQEGLFEKEAAAMVKTWQSSWFGETGTRLFYIVPRPLTDALLPLEISPRPERTVRVLVGRMEMMTPEDESRIASLVLESAHSRKAATNTSGALTNYNPQASLANLGRLAEPALARVGTISKNPEIRAEAKLLLQWLASQKHQASDDRHAARDR
jgi:hypothetical protein